MSRWGDGRRPGRQTEGIEKLPDRCRLGERGDDLHRAPTLSTAAHVYLNDTGQQPGPLHWTRGLRFDPLWASGAALGAVNADGPGTICARAAAAGASTPW